LVETIKKSKGEQTRALILETALRLFRERGYAETTMRAIAEQADVALGNAYYYFRSKEDLIQEFYVRMQAAQLAACEGVLATERTLKNRITGIIRAHLSVCSPYRGLFATLFQIAANPASALNPFSKETEALRNTSIARFAEVVQGAEEKISADIKVELPYLLWMYNLAIVLFWIYDASPGQVRTYRLLELSADLIANLVALTSSPIMTPIRKTTLKMLHAIKEV